MDAGYPPHFNIRKEVSMFWGKTFIFNNTPSETYNLQILNFESTGGVADSPAGSNATVYQTWLYRKPQPYFYGKSMNTPLTFDLTIGSFDPIWGVDRGFINRWLLGRSTYLPLQICQDDMDDIYFNVMFTSAENKYVGNIQRGVVLHGQCDAPWGFTETKSLSYAFPDGVLQNLNFTFDNNSDDSDYLYPIISFKTNNIGSGIVLTNSTDAGRIFQFTSISSDETVVVNNSLQTMTSDSGSRRMTQFNKKWFRLMPGLNNLNLQGGLRSFDMTYKFARKIGA